MKQTIKKIYTYGKHQTHIVLLFLLWCLWRPKFTIATNWSGVWTVCFNLCFI